MRRHNSTRRTHCIVAMRINVPLLPLVCHNFMPKIYCIITTRLCVPLLLMLRTDTSHSTISLYAQWAQTQNTFLNSFPTYWLRSGQQCVWEQRGNFKHSIRKKELLINRRKVFRSLHSQQTKSGEMKCITCIVCSISWPDSLLHDNQSYATVTITLTIMLHYLGNNTDTPQLSNVSCRSAKKASCAIGFSPVRFLSVG